MRAIRKTGVTNALAAVVVITAGAAVARPDRPTTGPATAPAKLATSFPAAPPGARITPEGWFAPLTPGPDRPTPPRQVNVAFVIPMREMITTKTYKALKRKVVHCRAAGAELIVFDMDTWGGEAMAALDIARLLKVELEDIYTVCYVRTRAVSAGALIAMACDEIIMTNTGKLGDAAPIAMGGKLEGVEREKIETVLRKEFAESARRNGYPAALAESMVTITREVWLVRNKATGELRYVLRKDFAGKVAASPGATTAPSNPKGQWDLMRVLVTNKELLTVTPGEAKEYGFVRELIKAPRGDELRGVMEHYNVVGAAKVLSDNWSERLVEFLTTPAVVAFLFFAAILCGYIEMNTPGFGVAGSLALVCFAVIFGSRFLVGMAAWWEIALFVVGLALIAVEVFVLPGFGVAGISGILCCVVGLLAMLVDNPPDRLPIPSTSLSWSTFTNGVLALMVGFITALVAAALLAKYLPKTPVAGRLILAGPTIEPISPAEQGAPIHKVRVGATGTVKATCRPVGQVWIEDALVDAIADGEFISAGAKVKVVKVEGNRIVVTPVA